MRPSITLLFRCRSLLGHLLNYWLVLNPVVFFDLHLNRRLKTCASGGINERERALVNEPDTVCVYNELLHQSELGGY